MDGIIDIIIAVLFIAIPAIFKAIGNNLEKSGKPEKAGKFKKIAEAMTDDGTRGGSDGSDESDEIDMPALDDVDENVEEYIFNEPVPEVQMIPKTCEPGVENVVQHIRTTARPERIQPTNRKSPILLEESDKKEAAEKIDPKKLVIYSEIMKTKF